MTKVIKTMPGVIQPSDLALIPKGIFSSKENRNYYGFLESDAGKFGL
jgi:hypothetical protein